MDKTVEGEDVPVDGSERRAQETNRFVSPEQQRMDQDNEALSGPPFNPTTSRPTKPRRHQRKQSKKKKIVNNENVSEEVETEEDGDDTRPGDSDDHENPNVTASKPSTIAAAAAAATTTTTTEAPKTRSSKANKERKRHQRRTKNSNDGEEMKTGNVVAASTPASSSSSSSSPTKTRGKQARDKRKRRQPNLSDSSNDVKNQNEGEIVEEEKVDSDHDSDDTRPGAFRVAGATSDDETSMYEVINVGGDDHYNTNTSSAQETTIIPNLSSVIEAEQVDEEALEKEYQERARQAILHRIQEETTTHAVQIDPKDTEEKKEGPTAHFYRWLLIFLLVLAIMCAIVLPITLRSSETKQQKQSQQQQSDAPILRNGDNEELSDLEFVQELVLLQLSDNATKNIYRNHFQDSSSAQYKALDWLVHDDPAALNLTATESSTIIERYVLAVLYYSTNGQDWNYDYFLVSLPACDWAGIECDGTNSIVKIALESNNLKGSIPMELSFLTSFEEIALGYNKLSGTIPSDLALLTRLEGLQVPFNSLTGSIPEDFQDLTNLEYMFVGANQLTGTIPTRLIQLPLLNVFHARYNLLSGTIPEINLQHRSFEILSIGDNILSGSIPESLTNLVNLVGLTLSRNQLIGTIPLQIGMLTKLEDVWLDGNQLFGTIPTSLGELEYLEALSLSSNNRLNGTIPTEFGKLASLKFAYLHRNQFSGTLPSELGQLRKLHTLFIDANPVNGTIPSTFSQLSALELLGLSKTDLTGDLDLPICNQTNRIKLLLADCRSPSPEVDCSCCTTCCDDLDGCARNDQQACTNYSRDLELNILQHQAPCSCTDDIANAFCDLTKCPTCNEDLSVCGIITEFQYTFNEIILPTQWISTIQYKNGQHAKHTLSWDYDVESATCKIYVNGVECNSCTFSACADGFRGKSIDCNNVLNVDGPLAYSSCYPPEEESVLDIIRWVDTDSWTGCPFAPMEYLL